MPARYRALSLMFLLTLVTYLDRVCISATAGAMSEELGLSKAQMGDVFSIFVLGYVLFEIPGGWLADRYGARALLARIVAWWSLFTALTGLAWSYGSLLAIRFLFGCGEAGAFPGCASAISRWFPAAERGRAQAVIMVGSRLGAAFAPLLVIGVMARTGWRPVYWIFAGLGLLWAAAWAWWYRNWPEEHPSVSPQERAHILAGRHVIAHEGGAPWGRLLRSRNVWALAAMYSGYAWGLYFYLTWLPTYLLEGRGIAWERVGLAASAPMLAGAGANYLGGWLTDALSRRIPLRLARRIPAMGGLLAAAALLVAAAKAESNAVSLTALALSFGCADLILAICWATCMDVGREQAGLVSGFMNSLGQVGAVLAPAVIGRLVEAFGSWEIPLLISAGYYVVSAGIWLWIDAEKPLATPA
ncbi:MAG: MFS transporter [Acidobacteria bacterium]|nr:MFS transporter [Acidobacteriota bacterium]